MCLEKAVGERNQKGTEERDETRAKDNEERASDFRVAL